jgi:hypothetical protein
MLFVTSVKEFDKRITKRSAKVAESNAKCTRSNATGKKSSAKITNGKPGSTNGAPICAKRDSRNAILRSKTRDGRYANAFDMADLDNCVRLSTAPRK